MYLGGPEKTNGHPFRQDLNQGQKGQFDHNSIILLTH